MMTLEQAKEAAALVLSNLVHYPKVRRMYYPDDLTTVAIALMKAQNESTKAMDASGCPLHGK